MSAAGNILRIMSEAGLSTQARRTAPDGHEIELVKGLRAKGAGWYRIAQAIGRSEPDTRAYHDPGYEPTWRPREGVAMKSARHPLPVVVEASEAEAKAEARARAARTHCSPMEARVVLALAGGPLSSLEVGELIERSRDYASNVLAKLTAKGMVRTKVLTTQKGKAFRYVLTEAGREALARARAGDFDHG